VRARRDASRWCPSSQVTRGPPAGVGTVVFSASTAGVTATLTGTTLRAADHSVGLLLLDAATGKPLALDYGFSTERTTDASGLIESVTVPFGSPMPASVRAYLMVDAYPAARQTLP
jgi:hypothetical protein